MISPGNFPFKEAQDAAGVKSILPTSGKHADLTKLDPALKRRALWSATVTQASVLDQIGSGVESILNGEADQATIRAGLKSILADVGYAPDPEKAGGIEDVSSTLRLNTVIETQVDIARGAGWYAQGMQESVLDEFPAQELFRAFSPKNGVKSERNWAERWVKAGGKFYDGRMVALKTDDIWSRLGSSDLFPDGLDNPFPPFAFNSGMDVRDIDREETEMLGLIAPGEKQQPLETDLEPEISAGPEIRNAWLREAIADSGLGSFDSKGVLHFEGGGA